MRVWIACLVALAVLGCAAPKEPKVVSTTPAAQPAPVAPALGSQLDQAGVPKYPGSTQVGAAVTPETQGETRFTVLLSTPDSVDKAAYYYRDRLKFEGMAKGDQYQLIGKTKE